MKLNSKWMSISPKDEHKPNKRTDPSHMKSQILFEQYGEQEKNTYNNFASCL